MRDGYNKKNLRSRSSLHDAESQAVILKGATGG